MTRCHAVLDASFWINGHRGGILDFLPDYFVLLAPSVVVEEIEYPSPLTGLLTPAGHVFRQWRLAGRVNVQDPQQPVNWHQPGENAAIGLALECRYVLLIDDHAPYHRAKAESLPVVSTADLATYLYIQGRWSRSVAQAAIHRLGINRKLARTALTMMERIARTRGEGP